MVLLCGQYSTGKTSFIKFLLEREFLLLDPDEQERCAPDVIMKNTRALHRCGIFST